MAEKSIKKNIVFSAINTFITLAFPLITFPYISRVLMPAGIGQYSFIVSLVSYFILFANLGIPLYATKLIAENRDDKEKLRLAASKMFYLSFFLSVFVTLLYIVFVFIDSKGKENVVLYLIIGLQILSNALSVDWYYSATEKFGYIAIRNFITKAICIALIFIFVKHKDDLIIYACIMILSVFAYALINLIKFVKEVKPTVKIKDFKGCFIPIIGVFALHIAAKINASLDTIMLGYMVGDVSVGLYVSATKVINMVIDILLVINTVLLPRIANYISNGKKEEAKRLLKKSFMLVFALVVPATIGLSFLSKEIILLLSGEMYAEAIGTMTLMCFNVFSVVFANYLGVQVLYAFGRTSSTTISIAIGAGLNLALNFLLIPRYSHFGAGITTVISNMVIFIIQAILVAKYCRFNVVNKENIKVLLASAMMGMSLIVLQVFNAFGLNIFLSLILKMVVASIIYFLMLLLLRHNYVMQGIDFAKNKLIRKKVDKI